MAIYCTRDDIEAIYGKANVKKWADLDNRGDAEQIAGRVTYMCALASAKLDSYLRGGPYGLPFVAPYDILIIDLAARLAAYLLYMGRAADDEDEGQLDFNKIRKEVMADVASVRAGVTQLNLVDGTTRIPTVVDD